MSLIPSRTLRSHTSSSSSGENGMVARQAVKTVGGNNPIMGKAGLQRQQRAALGDLGNVRRVQQEQPQQAKKPGRALTKQNGTSKLSLAVLAADKRSTRSSGSGSKRKDEEQMDVDDVFAALPSHHDAMETSFLTEEFVLPADVDDIDAEDVNNPQMVTEYVNENYAYMRQLEREMGVRADYMTESKTVLKPRMRNLMVDWLVDVHLQFSLLHETLYMCVGIMDRYFQTKSDKLSTKDVQLVGITSLFIAAKYEEMYPPELGDFVYITDKAYTDKQILKMEIEIISTLNFSLSRPLPLNFLRRNSKAGMVDAETHTLAKYAMEVALVDYEMSHFHPSVAAASALALAISVHAGSASRLRSDLWNANLRFYTSYTVGELEQCLSTMAKRILVINSENTTEAVREQDSSKAKKRVNRAVFKKYSSKKFSKIALHPALGEGVLQDLARRAF